ncbi:MAG: VWA domain-containing protein [Lentisphaeria bacterium]
MAISFSHPYILWLLLLPCLLLFRARGRALPVADLHSLAGERNHWRHYVYWWRWCVLLSAALLILGASEPHLTWQKHRLETLRPNLMLVLDVSGSMEAVDWPEDLPMPEPFPENGLPPNRLLTAQQTIHWLLEQNPAFRTGLVAFAQQPCLVCPLMRKTELLQKRLDSLQTTDFADGTALGEAILCAVRALQTETADRQKILVLLSDGADHSSGQTRPEEAAVLAAEHGVIIYTIGIGGKRGYHPVNTDSGRRWEAVAEQLDKGILQTISTQTAGTYFSAADTENLLVAIHRLVEKMANKTIERKQPERKALQRELLLATLCCLILASFFRYQFPILQFP